MASTGLSGTWTYRSFRDLPGEVDDFGSLRFAQAEMRLRVADDGTVTGMLVFRTAPSLVGMDLNGRISGAELPHLRMTGLGQPGTSVADYHYEYDGTLLPHWPTGIGQRTVLAGTVLRAADHGTGAAFSPAGETASFLAVRRDDPVPASS